MVKKIIFGLIAMIVILSIVSASDTEIKVKTLPNHKVSVFIYQPGNVNIIDSQHIMADNNGEVKFIYSTSKSKIDLLVKVTKDGNKIFLEKFEDYTTGKPIYIRIDNEEITGEYNPTAVASVNITNNTESRGNETNIDNDVVENISIESMDSGSQEGVTGAVVSSDENKKLNLNIIYFIVLGIVIIGVLMFFIIRKGRVKRINVAQSEIPKKMTSTDFSKRLSGMIPLENEALTNKQELKNDSSGNSTVGTSGDDEIKKLEEKIKEAQKQLNFIKNKERIKEAEARLEADKRELDRLREESES